MDMSAYRDLFVSEARNHLSAFSELIVHLENNPADSSAINELFRHAHSLKGMAATMGYDQVERIAHFMENHLGRLRSGEFCLMPVLADLLLEGSDALSRLVSGIESDSEPFENGAGLIERLASFAPSAENESISSSDAPDETVLLLGETPVSVQHQFRQTDSFKSVRIKTETLDHLVNITGELITNRYRLAESIRQADAAECLEPLRQLTALLHSLRDEVFKARMLPFSFIAERFPRLVRDLARKQGKEIHYQLTGKEIELDRGILEEIAEPIIHLLRNAVDHGLESADERVMAGKPFAGTITLMVRRDKDHVEITIADDGRGMEQERLKQKAVEKGIITPERASQMSPEEVYQLVCAPGFSTAAVVTDISGRGVGMDAVREAVHALGGVLTIFSHSGEGSRFVMRLPMTVSIIQALMVHSGPLDILIPLNNVNRTLELKRSEHLDESGRLTLTLEEVAFPVRSLRQALALPPPSGTEAELLPVVVCDIGGAPLVLSVDRISGQQEVFIRPLRSPLSHLRGVSGATITGDGRVLFVADVTALV